VILSNYLVLSALLFTIGTLAVLLRRNAIVVFMGIEPRSPWSPTPAAAAWRSCGPACSAPGCRPRWSG
jgi:hypothetical protein